MRLNKFFFYLPTYKYSLKLFSKLKTGRKYWKIIQWGYSQKQTLCFVQKIKYWRSYSYCYTYSSRYWLISISKRYKNSICNLDKRAKLIL